ncbi:MAG: hypothetical protein SOU13_10305 [Eubacteriales bacterium]|nr:hypothetical protein [Eubacteriales bacterium]
MKKVLLITIAIILALPTTALAAGKATVTQEAFYVTPFLGYFAGEIYCEITNTGDKPVKLESGVYEFYDADGESIDSGSIYSFYPRILLPGEKGTAIITSGIKEATEPAYIADYSVSVVGKSAKPEDVLRYPVSFLSSASLRGHWNRFSVRRLYSRIYPVPSQYSALMRSARLPQNRYSDVSSIS